MKGSEGSPPLGQVHSSSPPSLPQAYEGRCGLAWRERSLPEVVPVNRFEMGAYLGWSSTGGRPQTAASHSPMTPSDRQPSPYWYFGPSLRSSSTASGE